MIAVRPQTPADLAEIDAINAAAFADHGGTGAFDRFREQRSDIISLVAEIDGQIVGHVLFSPVILEAPEGPVAGMGLGQLAVDPAHQRQGIGTQLTEAGLGQLRHQGCPFVIVIGHADYYPRFGFEPGSKHNFACQWDGIPDASFMVLFTAAENSDTLSGTASFDGM
jgi:putative acetyltransferase